MNYKISDRNEDHLKCFISVLFFRGFAQYPFEGYPALKFTKIQFVNSYNKRDSSSFATAEYQGYKIVLLGGNQKDSSSLVLYYKKTLVKKVKVYFEIFPYGRDCLLYAGDINGDGMIDFKMRFPNWSGSGLASSRILNLYLFNQGNHQFKKIFFTDFYEDQVKKEVDFNGDGNYEIVSSDYQSYNNHAYWVFDIFNYERGKLVNVSLKYNYPIMIRALTPKPIYLISKKVSKADMRMFSRKLPRFYEEDK